MVIIPVIVSVFTFLICFVVFNAIFQGALMELINAEIEREMQRAQGANFNAQIVLLSFLVGVGYIAMMYFTNRFLIKYVFRKIEQPLEMLSSGVHQISEGNLDYRIIYREDDEFKSVCEDFNRMAARLKTSIEEVQKNEQNRKELIAGISHDLRSPLTSVKGFVEGLLDGVAATSEMRQEYLQIIKQKTDDINSMVSKLFLYSKMDMGNYPTFPEKLDIGKEISDFVDASQEEYKSRGLIIETGDMPTERYIHADPVQLRSVFANILDNSAKYKEKETATETVSCAVNNSVIQIVFEDNGPGIQRDALLKIFNVFYRGDPSRNNPQKGSGLGTRHYSKGYGTHAGQNLR
jgi:signal transduction histidine kinase